MTSKTTNAVENGSVWLYDQYKTIKVQWN